VIGDIKHYALNDQENGRNFVNVQIEKRAMRESDLLAFEIGVKDSGVGAVMCSYNLLNGDYACENSYLLNDALKTDFGFRGFVLSDWGATHSTVKAALAGLDLEISPAEFVFKGQFAPRGNQDAVRQIQREPAQDSEGCSRTSGNPFGSAPNLQVRSSRAQNSCRIRYGL